MEDGFEGVADATLLLTVLLVASSVVTVVGHAPEAGTLAAGLRYAQDTRLALFRSTPDGLGYVADGAFVPMPNGTTVEAFLRVQVYLRDGRSDFDFAVANERVSELATRVARPGWNVAIQGRVVGGPPVVHIPESATFPDAHFGAGWTYPALDGGNADTHLSVAVWPAPLDA